MNRRDKSTGYIVIITYLSLILLISCTQSPILQKDDSRHVTNSSDKISSELEQLNTKALRHMMDGQLYLDQGDFAMAIVELQEAQSLEPNVSSVYISLAECYWNLNKPERSMEMLDTAVEIDPENTSIREMMAEQLFRLQDFSRSEEQYKILLDLNPGSEDYLFALGDLAKIQKKYKQAIEYYRNVYEIDDNNIQALEMTVDLTHGMVMYEEADKNY